MSNESKQPAAKAKTLSAKQVGNLLLDNALYILMVIAVIVIQIVNPNFLRPASLVNILSQTAAYLPAALGIAGCIVLTGTDLSAGRAVGLTACISASLLQVVGSSSKMWPEMGTLPVALVILIAVLLGAAIGASGRTTFVSSCVPSIVGLLMSSNLWITSYMVSCKGLISSKTTGIFSPKAEAKGRQVSSGKAKTQKIGTYTFVRLTSGKTLD